jgi:hypothetical protein
MIDLINFIQGKNTFSLLLRADTKISSISAKFTPDVPKEFNLERINGNDDAKIQVSVETSNDYRITVFLSELPEPTSHEYSITLLFSSSSASHYIEIVRQSEDFLESRFGFIRPGGYCILGRRNLRIGQSDNIQELCPQIFWGEAKVPVVKSEVEKTADYTEIDLARQILTELVSRNVNTGPVGKNHREYNQGSFHKKLKMLSTGRYAVQCTGFRDLFVQLAVSAHLKVRSIDANNYAPQFPDLISYSHSLCEIYISALDGYVLFDPWFAGLMLHDDSGVPLRVEDIQSVAPDQLKLVSLLSQIDRLVIDGDGHPATYSFKANDISLNAYFFIRELSTGMCGYQEYFQYVRRRSAVIKNRFCLYPFLIKETALRAGQKLVSMSGIKLIK